MSIQLQGNAESTFTNNVTINRTSGDQHCLVASHGDNDNQAWIAGNGYIFTRNGLAVGGTGEGQGIGNAVIAYDGSATFGGGKISLSADGSIQANTSVAGGSPITHTTNGQYGQGLILNANSPTSATDTAIVVYLNGSKTYGINYGGNANFKNVVLDLDTGGTLDVKERIQNTQAILYRLKAALIQPDADVNTLRTRLLEALDILTSDGDES